MTSYPAKSRLKPFCLFLFFLSAGQVVRGQLYASFSMDQTGGCSPLVVNFTNRTTGASSNAVYSWDFGNGNTSALVQGAAAVYTDEQTYTVTLTVQDGANQSVSTQQVTVYKPPTVDFTVNAPNICLESPAIFTANANGGGVAISGYAWDFGDGSTTESSFNVQQHQYTSVQTPTISLTVTNSYGCHATIVKKNIVNIIPALTSGFTADKTVLCLVSDAVQFTNTSNGPGTLDYLWDFGDNTNSTALNPSHIFNKKGFYSTSLTVHNSFGCTVTSTQSNPLDVAAYSTSFTVPSPICVGSYTTFTSTSSPAPDNTSWQLDGVNQPFNFGSFSTYFSAPGTHTITLNNIFGTCPQSASQQISVKALPVPAAFSSKIDGVCGSPVPVEFKDASAGAVAWQWNFNAYGYNYGGGFVQGTSTVQAPTFTYNADGNYPVSLQITNADGCSASTVQFVNIVRPVISIVEGPGVLSHCDSLITIPFSTSSTDAVVKANWNFGDGGMSTSLTPTHGFANTGAIYDVTVNYTTANGCTGSTFIYVYTSGPYPPPVYVNAIGAPSLATCLMPITTNFSINTGVQLSTTNWSLGDGTTSTAPSLTHTYTNPGTYVATLNYVTQSGCKGTVTSVPIIIDPHVKLTFSETPNPVCGNNPVFFVMSSTTPDNNVINWSFGDGGFAYTTNNPTYQYNQPGNYIVSLYVRNAGGCDTTVSEPITVNPPVPRIVGHTNTCDGNRRTVTFTQASIDANTVTWNFGDDSTLTTPGNQTTVTHVYAGSAEYYHITLTATNGQCSVVAVDPNPVFVLAKQSPLLTFSQPSVCTNGSVNMVISRLDGNPYQLSGQIGALYAGYYIGQGQYGDNTLFQGNRMDSSQIFPYNYAWSTRYTATLSNFKSGETGIRFILTSAGFNCQDTTNFAPLQIKGATGGFEIESDHVCYQSPVILKDTSSSTGNNPILSWQWNFGDGRTLNAKQGGTVTHNYANPGSYLVSMQITDAAGCSPGTPYTQNVVVNGPQASFYASGTDVHLNTTVYFYNTTNDYGNSNTVYTWNFGDGSPVSNDPYPSHTYPVPGTYTVTMTATNPSVPCASTATPVTIIVRNFNSAFAFSSSYVAGGCPPLLVNFTNTSFGYESVDWDFGDGYTAGNLNYASHIYIDPGRYIVTLHVHGFNGLEGQFIDSILIYEPVVTLGPAPPAEACIGDTIQLSSMAQNTSSFIWDFGDGTLVPSSNGTSLHEYLTAGTYTATLLTKNPSGCTTDTTLSSPVKIRPDPTIIFSPPGPVILCKNSSVDLEASGGVTYQWAPAKGLSDSTIDDPVASPESSTTYLLTIKDDIGCKNQAPLTIQVIPPGDLQVSKDDTVCAGESVKLNASGETLYQWIGDITGLSDTSITNPVALAPVTTTYTVQGSDAYYCFVDQKTVTVTVRPLPTVNAGPDVLVEAGYTATLDAIGSSDVVSYAWTPGSYLNCANCPSPVSTPLATTAYTVIVKNQYGCKAADTVVVAVDCQESHVRIPNAFTPGDAANNVFIVKGISIIKHMVVFDRWGEKVYEKDNFISGDRSSCWDGTFRGRPCPAGAYVYFVEMECPTGGVFSRQGSFVLIR